jgi:nitric oxide reductase activation protein
MNEKTINASYKAQAEKTFYSAIKANFAGLGATKASLRKLLISIDNVGWSRREECGRVDRRAFTRFAAGERAVFSRREYKEADRSAVSVLVDVSGSTAQPVDLLWSRIDAFTTVTANLCKLLDECGASVGVNAFHGIRSDDATGPIEHVKFIELKRFNQSLRSSAANIGALPALVTGCTPDYASVYETLVDLSTRSEKRKVLILITDADTFITGNHRRLDRLADKLGIVIIALCIGGDISQCYTHHVNVKSAAELFSGAFNKLLNAIRKGKQ